MTRHLRWHPGLVAAGVLVVCSLIACAVLDDLDFFHSERETFRLVVLVKRLDHPWGLAFLPDGDLLVTERPGRLRRVHAGALDPRPIGGLPDVVAEEQGGLLDVALHPHYQANGWVYLSYVARDVEGVGVEVLRGTLRGAQLEDVKRIFRAQPKAPLNVNFGSRLLFDRAGRLYITVGDRSERYLAQRLDNDLGKIIRLEADGQVPDVNPFVQRPAARPEIFSYGHRNPQGLALHPETGVIWEHEHGPLGGDEVNILRSGANYGWPVVTYGREYETGLPIGEGFAKAGMESPIYYWVPLSIAPSGMAFYDGTAFPDWRGSLFLGALQGQALVRLELAGERVVREERLLPHVLGRIRDVRCGPDGLLYLLSDSSRGVLARLEPVHLPRPTSPR